MNEQATGKQDDFVFTYFNGVETIHGDPEDLHLRLLEAAQGQLGKLLKASRERGPANEEGDTMEALEAKAAERSRVFLGSIPAIRKVEAITRAAFGMVPFDPATGKGATVTQCNAVLTAFFRFLDGEKKSPDVSPTAPASSV